MSLKAANFSLDTIEKSVLYLIEFIFRHQNKFAVMSGILCFQHEI